MLFRRHDIAVQNLFRSTTAREMYGCCCRWPIDTTITTIIVVVGAMYDRWGSKGQGRYSSTEYTEIFP